MIPVMSLLGATILTARATEWLAILAAVTALFALGAFGIQYLQLRDQLSERKRERQERRSAQAVQVYIWEERFIFAPTNAPRERRITAHVRNTSQQPVHDLRFWWIVEGVSAQSKQRPQPLLPDPNINQDNDTTRVPDGTDLAAISVAVTFRDRAGVQWRAHSDGKLEDLTASTRRTRNRKPMRTA